MSFSKAVMVQIVVEEADYSVGAFSDMVGFVDEVINLTWYGLTAHTKYVHLPLHQKVNWSWLKGIGSILSKIK